MTMDKEEDTGQYFHEGGLSAVIVGIDGYKEMRPLDCAVNDAVYLSGTLKKVWGRKRKGANPEISSP